MSVTTLGERDRRHHRVRSEMAAEGIDRLIVYGPGWRRDNIRYLTGCAVRSGWFLLELPLDGPTTAWMPAVTDAAELDRLGWVDDLVVQDLASLSGPGAKPGEVVGVVHEEVLPVAMAGRLAASMPPAQRRNATALMDRVRLVKTDAEIAALRRSAEVAALGWAALVDAMTPGAMEYELVAAVEEEIKRAGATDNFMLIATGGEDVWGMTSPTDRALLPGDMVRTELTPQVDGYYAQVCRSAVLGEPNPGQRRSHELFQEATRAGLDVIRPGVTAHEIARAQDDVFRDHGFGEYCSAQYTRVRGHGLGLHFDEHPIIDGGQTVFAENSVFIVHPNTYTPLAGYHVFGDTVVVTADGYEPLFPLPAQFPLPGQRPGAEASRR